MAVNINSIPVLIDSMATQFNNTKTYNEFDIVWYNGDLYQCKVDNVIGSFDLTKWNRICLADALKNDRYLIAAPIYDEAETYHLDDIVQKNHNLYVCVSEDGATFEENFKVYYIENAEVDDFHPEAIRILDALCANLGLTYTCTLDTDEKYQYTFKLN